ncbi:putative deoxyribonuclease TATDN2 [Trichonephila clavipes]|nr:putative deoxyribonuclease TATDN2 [Trichonephila clavipes]
MSFENYDESNNQKKKLAVLKSKENEQLTSSSMTWKTESPCSESSIKKYPGKSHSVCERDNLQDELSFTPRTSINKIKQRIKRFNLASPENMRVTSSFLRKSLPSKLESRFNSSYEDISNNGSLQRRKSFPCTKSPYHSPSSHSFHRYTTDQTPYTIENSYPQRKRFRPNLPRYNAFDLISLESKSGFIDSHCHLDFLLQRQGFEGTYADYQKRHQSTFPKAYQGCIAVFCNPFSFSKNCMWEKYLKDDKVWASFGCHPHNAKDYNDNIEKSLYAALEHTKVRALGEIGLDYSNRNNCLKEIQFKVFRRQLKIALNKELPVIIHCRDAHEDGMKIIKEILPKNYTIHLHCFTDIWEWAEKWLSEFPNLYIGITNVVTFPSAESIHEVGKKIPLDRLLLETDAPYFVPKMPVKTVNVEQDSVTQKLDELTNQIVMLKTEQKPKTEVSQHISYHIPQQNTLSRLTVTCSFCWKPNHLMKDCREFRRTMHTTLNQQQYSWPQQQQQYSWPQQQQYHNRSQNHLNPKDKNLLLSTLMKFKPAFSKCIKTLGHCDLVTPKIKTIHPHPISSTPYPIPQSLQTHAQNYLEELIAADIIEENTAE